MRRFNRFVIVCALLSFAALGAVSIAGAQDTAPASAVPCDSDLILNLYVADRFFNFSGVRESMVQAGVDTTAMVDLNRIDKGQYTPWFDSAMANMTATTPASTMTNEQIQGLSNLLMLDDASRQQMIDSTLPSSDLTAVTMLPAPQVTGEMPECSSLRTELNDFYTALALTDITGMMAAPDDTTGTTDTTGAVTDALSWTTALSGAAEVPGPGDPDGTGSASITIDTANSQVCYTLFVQNLTLPAQAAHIHRGAASEGGDVVLPLDLAPDATGNAVSCVVVDAALLAEIAQNPAGFYVNVHTTDFPDGAVRGQVLA